MLIGNITVKFSLFIMVVACSVAHFTCATENSNVAKKPTIISEKKIESKVIARLGNLKKFSSGSIIFSHRSVFRQLQGVNVCLETIGHLQSNP